MSIHVVVHGYGLDSLFQQSFYCFIHVILFPKSWSFLPLQKGRTIPYATTKLLNELFLFHWV